MDLILALSGFTAFALFVYLVIALVKPEIFP